MTKNKVTKSLRYLVLGIIAAILTAIPGQAAEKIYFVYGPLNLSLSVTSLEVFAKEGTVDQELAFYLNQVNPQQQAEFRKALQKSYQVDPVLISRFFNTSIGEDMLTRIGTLISIPGGRNGKYALRAALVQGAKSPEGLGVLSIMKNFPTNIQLNTERILNTASLVKKLEQATADMVAKMKDLSEKEAATNATVDFSRLPDLRQPGEYGYFKQTFTLFDTSRQRQFYVILYKPQKWRDGKTPVVIMSHGLASRPEDMEKYGQHLATYGYVVALPQHPGSDYQKLQDMIKGYASQITDINEFIDRPLDITYLLDELEKRNQSEFEGRLNLQQVGVAGYSFGGYTALALAGADIDFDYLQQECDINRNIPNTSLLLQCLALQLPRKNYHFRDQRVQAAIATHPVSSIFGLQGINKIDIPITIGGGTDDATTPPILEQVRTFTWLSNSEKYLALVKGSIHIDTSALDAGTLALIESVTGLTYPDRKLLDNYGYGMITAFFGLYIENNPIFRPYVQSSYAQYISQEPFPVYFISSSSSKQLTQTFEDFKNNK